MIIIWKNLSVSNYNYYNDNLQTDTHLLSRYQLIIWKNLFVWCTVQINELVRTGCKVRIWTVMKLCYFTERYAFSSESQWSLRPFLTSGWFTAAAITCSALWILKFKLAHLNFATSVSLLVHISSDYSSLSTSIIRLILEAFNFCSCLQTRSNFWLNSGSNNNSNNNNNNNNCHFIWR